MTETNDRRCLSESGVGTIVSLVEKDDYSKFTNWILKESPEM